MATAASTIGPTIQHPEPTRGIMDSAIPAPSSVGILETSLADHTHSAAMGTKMHCPTHTRLITPQFDRAVFLNRRLGAFDFVPGSAERSAFDALQKAAEGDPTPPPHLSPPRPAQSAVLLEQQGVHRSRHKHQQQRN